MIKRFKNLSVSKKLYTVVGLMAILIASELLTLIFVMDILSAVRSFVSGEGLWSKAQKDAVSSLQRFSVTFDKQYFSNYVDHLKIPLGDRQARLELIKPNPNLVVVREGFLAGEIHPNDIDGLIRLIRRFYWVSYVDHAVQVWTKADQQMDELMKTAEKLRVAVESPTVRRDFYKVDEALKEIEKLNLDLTILEKEFSYVLGEGSRWLEMVLRWLLFFAVLTVEATGLLLTFTFARNLTRSLENLSAVATEVGKGNFSQEVEVNSQDELGLLAAALNDMSRNLRKNIGERKRAESASKVKSMFLANMSHEIRTPLGVILGLTELLKDPSLSPGEHNKYLEIIERTGNNLKRIINDILDISKVEAGHLEIENTPFSLPDFLKELDSMLRLRAEQNNNHLGFEKIGEVPDQIFSDRIRLRQILVNLIGNALKFTKDGRITVEYGVGGGKLFFRIVDTGVGIAPEDRQDLFKPFSQVDSSSTRKYDGTGLGLLLSKKLANALGGDVVLESTSIGSGSSFMVTIAKEASPTKTRTPSTSVSTFDISQLNGKRVLVVDDSEDNRLLIQALLSRCQIQVECVDNGAAAIDKAIAKEFDLILMDVQMPIMDGQTATINLRKLGYKKPIIALTAHAMKEDRERCLKVGCNDYLTKPIEIKLFYEVIWRHMCQSPFAA